MRNRKGQAGAGVGSANPKGDIGAVPASEGCCPPCAIILTPFARMHAALAAPLGPGLQQPPQQHPPDSCVTIVTSVELRCLLLSHMRCT